MEKRADLHIHSRYSGGVSDKMRLHTLAREGKKKGIDIIGTGDCLHPKWRKEISDLERRKEGVYESDGMTFLLTCEVETKDRVHHLMLFPSMSKVEEFYERVERFSEDIDKNGRPHLSLSGEETALIAVETGSLFGPAHAFTPYTGLYGIHDSLNDAYGDLASNVSFLELGLSADTDYADKISELHDITYLSNSDAHSPFPHRLAREFNMIEVLDVSYNSFQKLFSGRKGSVKKNVGLPPREGKYNESACNQCYKHYSFEESVSRDWRCECGGTIKKGVKDRVNELKDTSPEERPDDRPGYLSLIPLQEIIAEAVGHSGTNTKKVKKIWDGLIQSFDNEVEVLCNAPANSIEKVSNKDVAGLIQDFREDKVEIKPGGGGEYGEIRSKSTNKKESQQSLMDF